VGWGGGEGSMGVRQVVELVALVQLLWRKTGVALGVDGSPVVGVRYGGDGVLRKAPTMISIHHQTMYSNINSTPSNHVQQYQFYTIKSCTAISIYLIFSN
jgi:hypothetical protein